MRSHLVPFLLSSLLISGCIMTGEDSDRVDFSVELLEANGSIKRTTLMEI